MTQEKFERDFYNQISKFLGDGVRSVIQKHHLVCQQFFDPLKYKKMAKFLDEIAIDHDILTLTFALVRRCQRYEYSSPKSLKLVDSFLGKELDQELSHLWRNRLSG